MPLKLPSFRARRDVYPPDLWTKCPTCSTMLFNKQLEKNLRVCAKCGHHFRLRVDARLAHLLDPDSFEERDAFLEDVPVADTVLVLDALARERRLKLGPLRSALLPG